MGPDRGPSHKHPETPGLGLAASRNGSNTLLLLVSYGVSGILSQQPEWTKILPFKLSPNLISSMITPEIAFPFNSKTTMALFITAYNPREHQLDSVSSILAAAQTELGRDWSMPDSHYDPHYKGPRVINSLRLNTSDHIIQYNVACAKR